MRGAPMVLAAAVVLSACHDSTSGPTVETVKNPPQVQPPTYVVFGTVRDERGAPVFGATAEIITGKYAGRTSISNASGYFAFPGVLGDMMIRIQREGYYRSVATLNVTGDVAFEVQLSSVVLSDTLQLGKAIRSDVPSSAPPCDPVRWDAMAPCKTFHFKAPTSGMLVITISWESLPELDATMVTILDDAYVATSVPAGKSELSMAGPVVAGVSYEIRVSAYYGGQVFTLRADLNAPSAQWKAPPSSLRR